MPRINTDFKKRISSGQLIDLTYKTRKKLVGKANNPEQIRKDRDHLHGNDVERGDIT